MNRTFSFFLTAAACALLSAHTTFSQTQYEMNAEAERAYKRADKELNQVYQELINLLSGAEREKVRTAQRSWIKSKESTCTREAGAYKGGSMYPMIYFNCLEDRTRKRTNKLRDLLSRQYEIEDAQSEE